jgi:hypothetical protein
VPDVELGLSVEVPEVPDVALDPLGVELVVAVGAELDVGAALDVGAEAAGAEGVEVRVGCDCVEPWPDAASGSVYCWSPADCASTVDGASTAAVTATMKKTRSLRGICGGQVWH